MSDDGWLMVAVCGLAALFIALLVTWAEYIG